MQNMRKVSNGGDARVRLYTLDGKCNISGPRIREARVKAGLSQEELAVRMQLAGLQMGQMAVSRIETGNVWFQTLSFRCWPTPWA